MIRKHIHSWEDGMDQDTSKRFYKNNRYFSSKNTRFVSSQQLSDGGIQTILGNEFIDKLSGGYPSHRFIGYGHVGKWTVLFSTKNTGDPGDYTSYSGEVYNFYTGDYYSVTVRFGFGADDLISVGDTVELLGRDGIRYSVIIENRSIWAEGAQIEFKIGAKTASNEIIFKKFDNDPVAPGFQTGLSVIMYVAAQNKDVIWKIDLSLDNPELVKVYEGPLTLSLDHPIYNEVVGYYMNEDIQKIYWADSYNYVRNINIADDNVDSLTPGKMDLIPDVDMEKPYLFDVSGGNLPVGAIQYAYQVYRDDGSITTFSPTSGLIHLTKSSENEKSDINYGGTNELDDDGNPNTSGKAVSISIDNLDLTFDNIRVVSILYTKLYGEPTINIVADLPISSSSIKIIDNGDNHQGMISLNLFRSLGGSLFKAKTLTNKDDILFAGNIQESFLDVDNLLGATGYWDARAYRWNNDQTVKLYTDSETTDFTNWTKEYEYTYTGSTGPLNNFYDSILEKSDVANSVNCASKTIDDYIDTFFNHNAGSEGYTGSVFLYQKDGYTKGGEGPNIKYNFITNVNLRTVFGADKPEYYSLQGSVNTDHKYYESYRSNANPLVSGLLNGYKSDEIYSFGIQFFNTKKQQSFVKWIGDVRFPRRMEGDMANSYTNGNQYWGITYLDPLGIRFEIDTSNLPSEITHFRIVRCKRTPSDRTIISQGLAFPPMIYTNSTPTTLRPHWYPTGSIDDDFVTTYYIKSLYNGVFLFHSPDLFYENTIQSIDWSVRVGRLANSVIYHLNENTAAWESFYVDNPALNPGGDYPKINHFNIVRFSELETLNSSEPTNITQQDIIAPAIDANVSNDIGVTYSYVNWYESHDIGGAIYGPHATTLTLKLEATQTDIGGGNGDALLIDLKKSRIPYGGYGYYSRLQREYIPCSEMKRVTGGVVSVISYEGDTYLDYAEYIKNLYHDSDSDSDPAVHTRVLYPVEASINPKLVDRQYSINQKSTKIYKQLHEEKGSYEMQGLSQLEQFYNFYTYNTVYSKQNDAELGFPKPDKTLYLTNNYLIKASNVKSRFTRADEWTNFASGNEINLEARYGTLNKLVPISNLILFFQDQGFGTISVNERAITQALSGVEIELGSTGVLSRYDYISKIAGLVHRLAITVTNFGVFWYDKINKKFWKYADKISDAGQKGGMQSYFNDLPEIGDTIFTDSDIIFGLNSRYREIWMTNNADGYETIIFNYGLERFVSFLDNSPDLYIFDKNGFHEAHYDTLGNRIKIYKNNADSYTIYSNSYTPEVSFIVSPKEFATAMFDIITWLNEKYDAVGNHVHGTTIDTIQFENDHQDSGEVNILPLNQGEPYNARRMDRVWRYDTIRDLTYEHMVDFYLKVTMKWSNQKFILHTVELIYRNL